MARVVQLPPESPLRADGLYRGGWWHDADEPGRIICDLCPRECHLKPGDRGFCFVRQNVDGEMMLTTYGRSTGFCIDPIEKKPLNHFLPGTSILSFGTAGCNLGCKFCQNWDISKSREIERLSEEASPNAVAEAALQNGCSSVAYTYNDPVIWAEYAIDTAKACRAVGVKNVAVTAGYISPAARAPFYEFMDAANVDLKAFTEDFYYKITYSHLQPVLDTLEWLKKETNVWFEITNLVIPDANDSMDEIRQMCDWLLSHVGDQVPIHFTAFHPDFRMRDRPATPHETLLQAYDVASRQGLKFVYVGNVYDVAHQSTYCPECQSLLIERNWYELGVYNLRDNRCGKCNHLIAGDFPTSPGNWGRKRVPVPMARFAEMLPIISNPAGEPSMSSTTPSPEPVSPRIQAQRPKLNESQKHAIQHAACEIVAAAIQRRAPQITDPTFAGAADKTVMGAFVTLKRQGRLRACCGSLGRPMKLSEALFHSAQRTALEDTRLPPLSLSELPFVDVDVTLLYGFQRLKSTGQERISDVVIGRHGVQVQRGESAGLLLPSVAVEHGYDAESFLQQVCRKAGLPSNAWLDAETNVQTFEGVSLAGDFAKDCLDGRLGEATLQFTDPELAEMAMHCGSNIVAFLRGATPSYYLSGCPDGTVQGVALTIKLPYLPQPIHLFRLAMRPGMPLQSTLLQLCEAAAASVAKQIQSISQIDGFQVGLTMLHDSAMHGTVDEPDLRGVDPRRRAVMIMENAKSAWAFDSSKSPDELLQIAKNDAHVSNTAVASVISFAAHSTEKAIVVSSVPRPSSGSSVRPPAVAGAFYPGIAADLSRLIGDLFNANQTVAEFWPAVMMPHAGLKYSGKIAAQTIQRVIVPDTVIIIGPKHTRLGVEWAVAPHEQWSLPGITLASDPQLAKELCDAIPGLQLDAAAHQQEHAIEVELPFIAQLNPRARVVGITIGGGSLQACKEFATGLANVLRSRTPRPLLIISSDMNHYANDAQTRQLDELAIESLEKLDPDLVYEVVTRHGISMCGVLPAVIVLETLRQLASLTKCQRVAYATSADATGESDRVVGYAGMLFG